MIFLKERSTKNFKNPQGTLDFSETQALCKSLIGHNSLFPEHSKQDSLSLKGSQKSSNFYQISKHILKLQMKSS